ncbi:MAG: hypothetical protein FD174_1612 [Geobacteraceae bacterium]|nr:MAG: hypothetical protein FD174_1612 [Geobacteraceae bacterium]
MKKTFCIVALGVLTACGSGNNGSNGVNTYVGTYELKATKVEMSQTSIPFQVYSTVTYATFQSYSGARYVNYRGEMQLTGAGIDIKTTGPIENRSFYGTAQSSISGTNGMFQVSPFPGMTYSIEYLIIDPLTIQFTYTPVVESNYVYPYLRYIDTWHKIR